MLHFGDGLSWGWRWMPCPRPMLQAVVDQARLNSHRGRDIVEEGGVGDGGAELWSMGDWGSGYACLGPDAACW